MVRNLPRLTADLDKAIEENDFSKKHLERISAYEPNVASMANLMKYMCFNSATDEPNFVNDLMNEVMIVLDELPERYRQAMFRDEMKIEDLMMAMRSVIILANEIRRHCLRAKSGLHTQTSTQPWRQSRS